MSRAVELELGDVCYTLRVGYFDLRDGEVELENKVSVSVDDPVDISLDDFLELYADYHAFSLGQARNNLEYEVLELLADQLDEDWDSGRESAFEIRRDLKGNG